VNRIPTTLIDGKTGRPVKALLLDNLTVAEINEVEKQWVIHRREGATRLHKLGLAVPEHWRWDWTEKSEKLKLLAYRSLGIKCGNTLQGLMMISTGVRTARMEPDTGKPIVYIEYLESAPWNVKPIVDEPQYRGVGIRLFEAAVRLSFSEEFNGRIGLHSLRQAERFYAEKCGMTAIGPDAKFQNLNYFELTREQAQEFLSEEETS